MHTAAPPTTPAPAAAPGPARRASIQANGMFCEATTPRFSALGGCRRGDRGRSHADTQRKPCKYFGDTSVQELCTSWEERAGKCRLGDACRHTHRRVAARGSSGGTGGGGSSPGSGSGDDSRGTASKMSDATPTLSHHSFWDRSHAGTGHRGFSETKVGVMTPVRPPRNASEKPWARAVGFSAVPRRTATWTAAGSMSRSFLRGGGVKRSVLLGPGQIQAGRIQAERIQAGWWVPAADEGGRRCPRSRQRHCWSHA
jgi:hypothetical protein